MDCRRKRAPRTWRGDGRVTAQVGDVPGGPEMREERIGCNNSSERRFRDIPRRHTGPD